MSLWKKFFGSDPAELEGKGDALLASGDFGPAKLAYEKALAAANGQERPGLEDKMRRCLDAIAQQRLDEAKAYLADGSIELAMHEIQGAIEVAVDEGLRAEARELLDGLEAEDAKARATPVEMTEEERIAVLMGTWEEEQAAEYERYGDSLLQALTWLHEEKADAALAELERLLQEATDPRYLWLEIGRARLLLDDHEGGRQALENFLAALDESSPEEPRLLAHLTLARMADEQGQFETAMRHHQAAVNATPQDYRPYMAMGAFLRNEGHGEEAFEVLHTALALSRNAPTDWRLLEELGLASEQVGKTEEATRFFEQVIEFFTSHRVTDFPPPTARALARLYESEGRIDRAADLYRALSQGTDRERHAFYHYDAGRLLLKLGLGEEAHRMLMRAQALATSEDLDLRERIEALLEP